jgi:hypothetical protein
VEGEAAHRGAGARVPVRAVPGHDPGRGRVRRRGVRVGGPEATSREARSQAKLGPATLKGNGRRARQRSPSH